jgi:hypothetical protein
MVQPAANGRRWIRLSWRESRDFVAIAAVVGLLFIDGRLGPVSFALRRATALTAMAAIAVERWRRSDRPVGVQGSYARSRSG